MSDHSAPITYIALLRAINVGGRFVKMDALREVFVGLGLQRVRTFIQSGNVFFDSPTTDKIELKRMIEAKLLERFGFEVPTILRTIDEIDETLARSPFNGAVPDENARFCIVFLPEPAPDIVVPPYRPEKLDFELLGAVGHDVFAIMYVQNGRPGNPAAYIEKKTKLKATARFFHTTIQLLEAAKQQ